MMSRMIILVAVILVAQTASALTAAEKCEADKLKRAGKYSFCRLKAESHAVRVGGTPDYTLCDQKLGQKWAHAESVGGGMCPTNGDLAGIQALVTGAANDVAECLSGTCGPNCGDGIANGTEPCDGGDLGSASCVTLGFAGGTLACTASCGFDVSGCQAPAFPASGQTTAYGVGSDGDVQAGAPLAFVDNGDGTISDINTGLMWEKKSDDGSIHDWNDTYSWGAASPPYAMTGTMVSNFLDVVNDVAGGGASCFAGHCDWRMPNRRELESLIDLEQFNPAVSAAFNNGCLPACTVMNCSCTQLSTMYWTSTTYQQAPLAAWLVNFGVGNVFGDVKTSAYLVRAVR